MKIRIIKTIYLILFVIVLIIGLLSFLPDHHSSILDTVITLLGAITYLFSYQTLSAQTIGEKDSSKFYYNRKLIKSLYISIFVLFAILAVISYLIQSNSLAFTTLLLCAVTQIAGYIVFRKKER